MNSRIKEIRIENCKNQKEFADRIGVGTSTVNNYEKGIRIPMDIIIKAICREFNVYEEWLKTGTGPKYIKRTENQDIAEFANTVMEKVPADIRKRLINALIALDDRDWETIDKLASAIVEGRK